MIADQPHDHAQLSAELVAVHPEPDATFGDVRGIAVLILIGIGLAGFPEVRHLVPCEDAIAAGMDETIDLYPGDAAFREENVRSLIVGGGANEVIDVSMHETEEADADLSDPPPGRKGSSEIGANPVSAEFDRSRVAS